jgi:hypothetical protein
MLSPLNKCENVVRETLLTKSDTESFLRLASLYGFPRPRYISIKAWRRALLNIMYTARSCPGPIFRFLENVFSDWIEGPGRYTATASAVNIIANSDFDCRHESRFVRINGDLYRTGAIRSGFPGELVMIPIGNTMFKAARFTPGESLTVDFLPFDIDERDCRYTIKIDAGVFQIPGAYFRSNGEDRETDPFGMHLMDFFSEVFEERFAHPVDGPFPIYLDAKEFASLFFDSLDLMLAAGVIEQVELVEWCPGEASIFGSVTDASRYGTVTPDRPAIITPTRS